MHNPVATYRLQFHEGFTFDDLERILPYLRRLGVSTIYAAPVLGSTRGSTHGYDGVDPHHIDREIGTEEGLRKISKTLQEYGMSWLQDIVPNHMAFNGENAWLMDVLQKGRHSPYARFFDIGWESEADGGRIMVPFLGTTLEEAAAKGDLKIEFKAGRLVLCYYDSCYPLNPHAYATVLHAGIADLHEPLRDLMAQLPKILLTISEKEFGKRWDDFLQRLNALMHDASDRTFIDTGLQEINNDPARILQIAESQYYRLCNWQETDSRINYRRFFTVNGLICLNIQDPEVFEQYHSFIKTLVDEGVFQGLRIDHIDGLYDPAGYLEQLRQMAGPETYIVVEKILEPGERLPGDWPIQGNTGYDFLSLVNNLFTDERSERKLTRFYDRLVGREASTQKQIHDKKAYILCEHMGGELENLYQLFLRSDLAAADSVAALKHEVLKKAIGELLVQCPVYRYYGNRLPLKKEEAAAVQDILNNVRKSKPELADGIALLENALLKKPGEGDAAYNARALHFYQRLMQFSGPLMAKGVEDTLMYTYSSFIGHNDVGDAPGAIELSREAFHKAMLERQTSWPLSINTTSTHDTKRGEGARARLNVLTDLPDEWLEAVKSWQAMNADLKQSGAPDANDAYFIYQTLIATYPVREEAGYADRIQEYLTKSLREAKTHSTWTEPDEGYESAAKAFAVGLLDKDRPFWKSFTALHRKVAHFGMVNSLAQVLLKFTCPGVPDVYQGTELWDLTLVDPDNRRPVDYAQRQQWLEDLQAREGEEGAALLSELWQQRSDARIKLWLVHRLYELRKSHPEVFAQGHYVPLRVTGRHKDYVLAFARRYREEWLLFAVPLNGAQLCERQGKDILELDWEDTRISLREEAPGEWADLLTGARGKGTDGIPVGEIFRTLPIAMLQLHQPVSGRGAGILLAISSLPSAFGVGDFGPEAKAFARFLSRSRQKCWQLLPLTPTEAGNGHSPYSSISSRAGNTLLISPEGLADAGLLDREALEGYKLPVTDKADYEGAQKVRNELFEMAWQRFREGASPTLQYEFRQFCEREGYWLRDFALFVLLKEHHNGAPWYQWAPPFKNREDEALNEFSAQHQAGIDKIQWLQFIFLKQWRDLKGYCNSLGIDMFGDIPFYISHDSAEVWAHRDIFRLDADGAMTGVAGVPPDYFSADGQLWGMPTFRWDVLKEQGYDWWVQRIRKSLELFDILRLDHFRAFQDYWEVPAGEETAKNGKWLPGPRTDIFRVFERELGALPFVAEDLGDNMDAVYVLRDELGLPGMKVLQFAFGDHLLASVDAPHNYTNTNCIVYTGTHDNNTSVGWFESEANKAGRQYLEQYLGHAVDRKNVHRELAALAYGSIARLAILPVQDVLGVDEGSRMNVPGSGSNNWVWRVKGEMLTSDVEQQLREWVVNYNRG